MDCVYVILSPQRVAQKAIFVFFVLTKFDFNRIKSAAKFATNEFSTNDGFVSGCHARHNDEIIAQE